MCIHIYMYIYLHLQPRVNLFSKDSPLGLSRVVTPVVAVFGLRCSSMDVAATTLCVTIKRLLKGASWTSDEC